MDVIKDPLGPPPAAAGPSMSGVEGDFPGSRADMDRAFDELGRKLAPARLFEDGWELVRDKTSAGARQLWQLARDHPLPALTVGVGVTWLAIESRRGISSLPQRWRRRGRRSHGGLPHRTGDLASRLGDKAGSVAGGVKDRAAELGGRFQRQARRASRGLAEILEQRPLAVGAASLALGLLAGLTLPATRREDELLGESRDELLERARTAGQEALESSKQAARDAVDRVKESVREQQLTPEQLAAKARHVAQDALASLREAERSLAQSLDGRGPAAGTQPPAGATSGAVPAPKGLGC
jgi:hypothetical protein